MGNLLQRRINDLLLCLGVAACVLFHSRLSAAPGDVLQTFSPAALAAGDEFGQAVAEVGGNALIGSPYYNRGAVVDAGRACLMDPGTGTVIRVFPNANPWPSAGDLYGTAVAALGEDIVIGSPYGDTGVGADSGAVYIYDGATGVYLRRLQPSGQFELFGLALATDGDNVLVGAPGYNGSRGRAYLFNGRTGALLQTFDNPSPNPGDDFGFSVALIGNVVLIGAPSEDTPASNSGLVYVFDAASGAPMAGWPVVANPSPFSGDRFGYTITRFQDDFVVGVPYENDASANAGIADLFSGKDGSLIRVFQNPFPSPSDFFGYAIAGSSRKLLISAPGVDVGGVGTAGRVYEFNGETGALLTFRDNPAPVSDFNFGNAVAAIGCYHWLVGAPSSSASSQSGVAYLIEGTCISPDVPANPLPFDGETTSCMLGKLDWRTGRDTTTYTVFLDGNDLGSTKTSEMDLSPPLTGGTHTFRVVAQNCCANTPGPAWSFCVKSDPPAGPVPPDATTVNCGTVKKLDWDDACGATTYTVLLDGAEIGTVNASEIGVSAVTDGGTHSWQVITGNDCSVTTGPAWSFCVKPDLPAAPTPADGEIASCGLAALDWNDTCGATTYTVFLDGLEKGETSASKFILSTPVTAGGSHMWQVVAWNNCSATTGPIWRLCIEPDKPGGEAPANMSVVSCGAIDLLDWSDACGATSYTVILDGVELGKTAVSQYNLSSAVTGPGTHTWQITALTDCTVNKSPLWSFCVKPDSPVGPSPAAGADVACGSVSLLDWSDVCGATTYSVYLDGALAGTSTASDLPVSSVTVGGTHAWQVVAENNCSETTGASWSFCVVPDSPAGETPVSGSTVGCGAVALLDWADTCGATSYTVYLDGVKQGTVASSQFAVPPVTAGGTHTWQAVAVTDCSVTTGPLWSFCVKPAVPAGPSPASGSVVACSSVGLLNWNDVCGATTYTVMLDGAAVATVGASQYNIAPPIATGGTHTWQIIAGNNCSETAGPVWTLCVRPDVPAGGSPGTGSVVACNSIGLLDWDDVCGATTYTVYLDGAPMATTAVSQYNVAPAVTGPGSHTWRVVAGNDCSQTIGPLWRFCIRPDAAANPTPQDGAIVGCASVGALDWGDVCGAANYTVFIDGVATGTTVVSSFNVVPPISQGGMHTWQIVSNDACASTPGPVWTFVVSPDVPAGPAPADGSSVACSSIGTLDWTDVCGATTYTVYMDGSARGTVAASQFAIVPPVATGGWHTWQVVAGNAQSETTGPVWQFCVRPDAPSAASPADGSSIDCQQNLTLQWSMACAATTYTVYIDGTAQAGVNVTSFDVPAGLSPSGTHAWQVVARNECGSTAGPVWTLCVRPRAPANPVPADGSAVACGAIGPLAWDDACGATTYTVYLDGVMQGAVGKNSFDVSPGVTGPGTHTWQVVAASDCEATTGPLWSFCVKPDAPSSPSPVDGATVACDSVGLLDWADACGASSYTVLMDGAVLGTAGASQFVVAPQVTAGGTHTWQVVAKSACSETTGPVWTFCVQPDVPAAPLPLDADLVACGSIGRLDWADTCGATTYTVYLDGASLGTTNTSEFDILPPLTEGSHTWQVVAGNACSLRSGPAWTFCVRPGVPGGESPSDGATVNCGAIGLLDWADVCGATTYTIYLDGASIGASVASQFSVAPVVTGPGTHTWHVVANGACTDTTGPLWTFCVRPDEPTGELPASGAIAACGSIGMLDWDDSCGATTYSVIIDGVNRGDVNASNYVVAPGITGGGTHTWQIAAGNACSQRAGPVWTFCVKPDAPAGGTPSGGAEAACDTVGLLDWADTCGATTYTVYLDGGVIGDTASSQYMVAPAVTAGGSHSWQIVAYNDCSATTGPLWEFCVKPDAASSESPGNASTVACGSVMQLDWADACGATTYTVYFDGTALGQTGASQYAIPPVTSGGAHTWQIAAGNGCSATTGPLWSFCVKPDAPAGEIPASGSRVGVGAIGLLDWADACGATSYTVYLDGAALGTVGASQFNVIPPVSAGGTHTWQVVASNSCSETTGPVWSLCVEPNVADLPSPASGSTVGCGAVGLLDWSDVPGATTYTVMLDGLSIGTAGVSQFNVVPPVTSGGTHAWQIIAGNDCSENAGPVWTFCVKPDVPSNESPATGSDVMCGSIGLLDWADTCGATTYTVLIDGTPVGVTPVSQYNVVPPITARGLHTWQVVAGNDCSETTGPLWTLCVKPEQPSGADPADGAVVSCSQIGLLDWADTCGATSYTVYLDGSAIGMTTDSQFTVAPPISVGGPHTWQVVAGNDCSEQPGAVWSFIVAAATPSVPSPADGETTRCGLSMLDWADACGATTYTVYLNGVLAGVTPTSQLPVGPLAGGTYTWQVIAETTSSATPGPLWGFSLTDPVSSPVSPADGELTDCALNRLDWNDACGATTYTVYIDGVFAADVTASECNIPSPLGGGLHSWRVESVAFYGRVSSPVWQFCLQNRPAVPVPSDGQTVDCSLSKLDWSNTCGAQNYDVYLDGALVANVVSSEYTLPGTLAPGPHTWSVDAWGCGQTKGNIWRFCLQDRPANPMPVDGETTTCQIVLLDWDDTCGATTYTVYIDGVVSGTVTTSEINLTGALPGGWHTWQIAAEGACGSTLGPVWQFALLDAPAAFSPVDGEVTRCSLRRLDWLEPCGVDSCGPTTYTVILDGTVIATTVDVSEYILPGFLTGGLHTWQILVENSCGTIVGRVFTFCLLDIPSGPIPGDCGIASCANPRLDWSDTCGAEMYDIYIGTVLWGSSATSDFLVDPLPGNSGGAYTWQVVARNSCGETTGPAWRVYVIDAPTNPNPPDGSFMCYSPTRLEWSGACGASDYQVYFDGAPLGTTSDNGITIAAPGPGLHTWQVIAINAGHSGCSVASVPSPVWEFVLPDANAPNSSVWMTNGQVYAMLTDRARDRIYIGGNFTWVGPASGYTTGAGWLPRNSIAEIDTVTGRATNWNPGANYPVYSLAMQGNMLYVGGDFTSIGGQQRERFAEIRKDSDTNNATSWNPRAGGIVRALAIENNRVYAGGEFTTFGATMRRYLAAVDIGRNTAAAFDPSPDYHVYDIEITSPTMYIAGAFSHVGSEPRNGIAKLKNMAGDVDLAWDAMADLYVYSMAVGRDKRLYVGGYFNRIGGLDRHNIAALDLSSGLAFTDWNPDSNGAIGCLMLSGTTLFVGGHFTHIGGQALPRFAAIDIRDSGSAQGCLFRPDNVVRCLGLPRNGLCMGGDFMYFGSNVSQGIGYFGVTSGSTRVSDWQVY